MAVLNGANHNFLQCLGKVDEGRVFIQLAAMLETTCPGKNRRDRVG